MSFINSSNGNAYAPGWFLTGDELCERQTRQMTSAMATTVDGRKIVKAGTVFPANDATAEGIVYEDIDVTNGDMPGSVVTKGTVYVDRLPVALQDAAKTALEGIGFVFIDDVPAVTRPY